MLRLHLALAALPLFLPAQTRAPGNDTITKAELEADLHFLASDELRGRLTGTAEYAISAKYIESKFRRLGLKPVDPAGSFEHRFTLLWTELADGNLLRIGRASTVEPKLLDGYMPQFFSANARAKGAVAFAGFGIDAPGLQWNELGPVLSGRFALILDGEPKPDDPSSIFDGVVTSVHSDPLRKALAAQNAGAIGVLLVNGRQPSDGVNRFASDARSYWPKTPPIVKRYALTSQSEKLRIPVASISPAVAQTLLGGRRLADLLAKAESGPQPPIVLEQEVELAVSLTPHYVQDRTVVAMIEGGDQKDEAVIVSAHYDHNGADGNQIYNGADDNGSGTVALMEIAEAYAIAAKNGQRPRRTVIFASWGSEERCCGPLLGAWAWVENPYWPLNKTVAVLNMDMIGRSEEVPAGGGSRFRGLAEQSAAANASAVNIIGTSYSPDMKQAVIAANASVDLLLRHRYDNNRSNLLRRSDQWPFLNMGVPALWFHTGLHPDYHTVFDRPEKIDYAKMERVARLVHQMSWNLAQQAGRPRMLQPRPIPPLD